MIRPSCRGMIGLAKWSAHVIFGIGGALAILRPGAASLLSIGVYAAAGSLLPDLDLKLRHRKLLHNLLALAVMVVVIVFVMENVWGYGRAESYKVWAPLSIGYILHILGDSFTKMGVRPLWPILPRRVVLADFDYDDLKLNVFLSLLGLFLIGYYIYNRVPLDLPG